MKEHRTIVRTYLVRLMCDQCDGGEMKPTGERFLSLPLQHVHRCDKCGHVETVRGGKTYPRIEYEE